VKNRIRANVNNNLVANSNKLINKQQDRHLEIWPKYHSHYSVLVVGQWIDGLGISNRYRYIDFVLCRHF